MKKPGCAQRMLPNRNTLTPLIRGKWQESRNARTDPRSLGTKNCLKNCLTIRATGLAQTQEKSQVHVFLFLSDVRTHISLDHCSHRMNTRLGRVQAPLSSLNKQCPSKLYEQSSTRKSPHSKGRASLQPLRETPKFASPPLHSLHSAVAQALCLPPACRPRGCRALALGKREAKAEARQERFKSARKTKERTARMSPQKHVSVAELRTVIQGRVLQARAFSTRTLQADSCTIHASHLSDIAGSYETPLPWKLKTKQRSASDLPY